MALRPHVLVVLAVAAGLVPTASAHDLPLLQESCQGTAPETVECTTGAHLYWGVAPSLGCGFEGGYVGTVESRMAYDTGFRAVRCTHNADGTVEGEAFGDGPDPLPLSQVEHLCASFEPGTTTQGGSGFWTCSVSH